MENNEEKKPKRPRIGENRIAASSEGETAIYGKVESDHSGDYSQNGETTSRQYGSYDRPYQPRNNYNNRQGGYNNRQNNYGNNRYNNQGGYNNNRQGGYGNNRYNNQGGYQPRQQYQSPAVTEGAETSAAEHSASEGYTPSTSQEGGYNNRYNNQGGYNNNRQGGYNNRQGGYNNNRQGGYNNQNGYNNRQGGFKKQAPRQNQYGMPQGGRSFTPRPRRIEYEMPLPQDLKPFILMAVVIPLAFSISLACC